MQKNEDSIRARWARKVREMKIKADFKYDVLFKNKVARANKSLEYEKEKLEKKKLAYIKKLEASYHKRMLNEIREWKGRPKREYKTE